MAKDPKLFEFLLRLGDSTLILGHRLSAWCGHSPALEEDIALTNTALDLVGQTQLWLELAGEVEGEARSANDLAYLRDAWDFRNLLLVERPSEDYALVIMRQYLFDAWHHPLLQRLAEAGEPRIADNAAKAVKEAAYHLDRSRDLVIRLGDGSQESHQRMQAALLDLWPYTGEMLTLDEVEADLHARGLIPALDDLAGLWRSEVQATLQAAKLEIPESTFAQLGGKSGTHSEHLGFILAEMQFLQRAYPGAAW